MSVLPGGKGPSATREAAPPTPLAPVGVAGLAVSPGGGRLVRPGRFLVRMRRVLRALGPVMPRPKRSEILRAAFGAGLALVLCGAILLGVDAALGGTARLLLIAPLGATSFLVFAVPNSPLAQPWSAIVGNGLSAAVAVTVLKLGLPIELSAGLAVGGAMAAMALARALHPPGAAVALATVLTASKWGALGYSFVFVPVVFDTILLVALATVYNRMTGRVYPFRQRPVGLHATADPSPERRLGLSAEDLSGVLDRFNLSANIGAEDFGRVLAAAEAEAARHYFDDLTCGDVMSRDVVSVTPETRLGVVADLFRQHRFKTLPVVAEGGKLCGIITQNDLIQRARGEALGSGTGFAAAMTRLADVARGGLRAGDIMTAELRTVTPQDGIGILVHLLADDGVQAAPVVAGGRLAGIVTRSDLLAVLARQTLLAPLVRRAA